MKYHIDQSGILQEMSWIAATILPSESGYYLTCYNNKDQNANMFKAFWFDVSNSKWIFRFDPDVKAWWNVRHDYYVPCQMQEGVDQFTFHFYNQGVENEKE